jgi:TonB family protein
MKSLIGLTALLAGLLCETTTASAETTIGIPHTCSPALLRTRAEGMIRISFVVMTDGSIADPVVAESSGNRDIDAASLNCVVHWRYKPARQDGQPIAVPWVADIAWNPRRPPAITQLLRDCAKTVSSKYPDAIDTEGTTNFAVRYENHKHPSPSGDRHGAVRKEARKAAVACNAAFHIRNQRLGAELQLLCESRQILPRRGL